MTDPAAGDCIIRQQVHRHRSILDNPAPSSSSAEYTKYIIFEVSSSNTVDVIAD